jgi:lon-related putative ATP-dependent protease
MKVLPADKLRQSCDPALLGFETTQESTGLVELIGQDRAMDAICLSSGMTHRDFNLFVLGPTGTGRHTAVQKILSEDAAKRPVPCDWAYVNNFEEAHKPKALQLPSGTAKTLQTAMQNLIDDLANDIPSLFESEDYQSQRRAIEAEFGEKHEASMADFAERAKAENIALVRTPVGFMLTAIRDGKLVKAEDFEQLDKAEQEKIEEQIARLQQDLAKILREGPKLEKEHRTKVEELNASMAERAVSARVSEVQAEFKDIGPISGYLEEVHKDIIANAELFLIAAGESQNGPFPEAIRKFHRDSEFDRYVVNVMVSQDAKTAKGAPVETEDLPSLDRLIGRIEHASHMGSLVTNFTMIKPGALHRANGGYLVLDARRLLSEPFAWDAVKQSIRNESITITSLSDRLSLVATTTLQPDPIPLDLRVVLVGDPFLYGLLVMLDPDFNDLFKVQADFEDAIDRTKDNLIRFGQLIAAYVSKEDMLPMTAHGVASVLDESTRMAEDTEKLSLRIGALGDLIREAEHYARARSSHHIENGDIERAVQERDRRASRIKDRMQEAIARKTILIDTKGAKTGQINGLSVLGIGSYRFGRPSRITARVRMGAGKLVDIEREVELGGPLHSKGVMILSGYLTSTYAQDVPFSLHASLVFEQSYGGVDGDSASSAELYALLSALSGVPIDQGLAVTGSVNQLGEVQAIGGVNEKIEGFFETCKAQGLTGSQGVLIPQANTAHLMLRTEVVEAARDGQFRIIPVETINEGIAILTGTPAGIRAADGHFEPETINAKIEQRLRDFAQTRKAFARMSEAAKEQGDT